MMKRFGIFVTLFSSLSAIGQTTERVLMPIAPDVVLGAAGSEWHTTVALTNLSDFPIQLSGLASGCVFECPDPTLGANTTVIALAPGRACAQSQGSFLTVYGGRLQDLSISLRTRDVSRSSQSWGTAIPVISQNATFQSTFGINDIPIDVAFRSKLRIYGFDRGNATVQVRVYGVDSRPYSWTNGTPADAPLLDTLATLQSSDDEACPSYAEVGLSAADLQAGYSLARVQISPVSNAAHIWAFASATNNVTQFVTVLAPSR
jgi:hypothetical protein